MSKFLKWFIIFLIITTPFYLLYYQLSKTEEMNSDFFNSNNTANKYIVNNTQSKDSENKEETSKETKNRLNVLFLGVDGARSDTIILASYNLDTKNLDLISIPRDTYYYSSNHKEAAHNKINAAYARGGVEDAVKAVSDVLEGIPIDKYVIINYKAVEKIVDVIDGVEVDIPFDMDYDDIAATPELHIHFSKGKQTLYGKQAIEYLRFRKNNDGTGYIRGDLDRIKAQQDFVKRAIKKSISLKLTKVIPTAFKYIDTNISLIDALSYAKNFLEFDMPKVQIHTLPGEAHLRGLYFFDKDTEKTKDLIKRIYQR